jgi:hypothetical protein
MLVRSRNPGKKSGVLRNTRFTSKTADIAKLAYRVDPEITDYYQLDLSEMELANTPYCCWLFAGVNEKSQEIFTIHLT